LSAIAEFLVKPLISLPQSATIPRLVDLTERSPDFIPALLYNQSWTKRMYWRRASIQDGQASARAWWRHFRKRFFPR